jgi:hypothetical protein
VGRFDHVPVVVQIKVSIRLKKLESMQGDAGPGPRVLVPVPERRSGGPVGCGSLVRQFGGLSIGPPLCLAGERVRDVDVPHICGTRSSSSRTVAPEDAIAREHFIPGPTDRRGHCLGAPVSKRAVDGGRAGGHDVNEYDTPVASFPSNTQSNRTGFALVA